MKEISTFKLALPLILILMLTLVLGGIAAAEQKTLLMATTTSTDNTGLLDYLAPHVADATGIELQWTAVGTGKALKMGENCDVDLLMVHAPDAEKTFVGAGFGVDRREVMYNDFIIIGPPSDPAGIKGNHTADALAAVMAQRTLFVSRGDNSGTHKKELALWAAAGQTLPEKEKWYIQTGQGMLASMMVAAERDGYILTDRGTYIKYEADHKGDPPLKIMVEGDETLKNQYSVIAIDAEHCPTVKRQLAQEFIEWMVEEEAQQLIQAFKLMDKTLFIPNAK